MRFEHCTNWKDYYDYSDGKLRRKKDGYNVYVRGKEEEANEIYRICDFMSEETGCHWDRFGDFDEVYGAFFLELEDRDMIIELKRAYRMAKK